MNVLPKERQAKIIRCLVEGMSMRSTTRILGVSRQTISRLQLLAGPACRAYHDKTLVDLPCTNLELDEIWAFLYAKRKNLEHAKQLPSGAGDVWTWIALCTDTKLIITWRVGNRDSDTGWPFLQDLARRLPQRPQITSDGHQPYMLLPEAFDYEVDFAQQFGKGGPENEAGGPLIVSGSPDMEQIGTSYAERQNLTMRMSLRRYTRKTNAFSKRMRYHQAAVAIYVVYYNFVRKHMTLKTTPAVAAGVADREWSLLDLVELIPQPEAGPRGPYRKRR